MRINKTSIKKGKTIKDIREIRDISEIIEIIEIDDSIRDAREKLIQGKKGWDNKEAREWLDSLLAMKTKKGKLNRWKREIGDIEELRRIIGKAITERKKKVTPSKFPMVKFDRATSEELLPLFLTKGIFSNFNKIPNILDLVDKEAKKIGRKLTAKERRELEVKTTEYKKDGYVWKEFPDYAIGFGYMQFTEYLEKVESEYQEKKGEVEAKPFLFPNMKREIEEVLRKVRLYKKGQSLAYGILGEVFLQRKFYEVELSKERAVYYIGKNPEQKKAYNEVKEILNSLRWLNYKIIGRGNLKLSGSGEFIFDLWQTPKAYILGVNPNYVGCIKYFIEDKKLHTKQKRKELFHRGYFNFPLKALAIGGDYSTATEEFRNYVLREAGNSHLNTKKYQVISQKIKVYIKKAYLSYKQESKNYQAFIDEVLPTLIKDKFISKLEPSLNKLKTLSPKRAYETNLKMYIPCIKEIDESLGEILKKKFNIIDIEK